MKYKPDNDYHISKCRQAKNTNFAATFCLKELMKCNFSLGGVVST